MRHFPYLMKSIPPNRFISFISHTQEISALPATFLIKTEILSEASKGVLMKKCYDTVLRWF